MRNTHYQAQIGLYQATLRFLPVRNDALTGTLIRLKTLKLPALYALC